MRVQAKPKGEQCKRIKGAKRTQGLPSTRAKTGLGVKVATYIHYVRIPIQKRKEKKERVREGKKGREEKWKKIEQKGDKVFLSNLFNFERLKL